MRPVVRLIGVIKSDLKYLQSLRAGAVFTFRYTFPLLIFLVGAVLIGFSFLGRVLLPPTAQIPWPVAVWGKQTFNNGFL